MTHPNEPTEALPTRRLDLDTGDLPWVALDPDTGDLPTVTVDPDTGDLPTVMVDPASLTRAHFEPTAAVTLPAGGWPDVPEGSATQAAEWPGMPDRSATQAASWPGMPDRSATRTDRAVRTAPVAAAPVSPGGEVRFGPGVPVNPPPTPAWPVLPPARRRRPWRTVTSALSTLLTLVLVAVVGLWIWQQLRPLEIDGVTVAVPEPAGNRCDVTVTVVATVRTNGRSGEIRYQWLRSDSTPGTLLTERVGRGQRTATLPLQWTFSGVGSSTPTATVNIVSPSAAQASTQVRYACRR